MPKTYKEAYEERQHKIKDKEGPLSGLFQGISEAASFVSERLPGAEKGYEKVGEDTPKPKQEEAYKSPGAPFPKPRPEREFDKSPGAPYPITEEEHKAQQIAEGEFPKPTNKFFLNLENEISDLDTKAQQEYEDHITTAKDKYRSEQNVINYIAAIELIGQSIIKYQAATDASRNGWDMRGMTFDKTDFTQFRQASKVELDTQLDMIGKGHAGALLRNKRRYDAKTKDHARYQEWIAQAVKHKRKLTAATLAHDRATGAAREKARRALEKEQRKAGVFGSKEMGKQYHKQSAIALSSAKSLPDDASNRERVAAVAKVKQVFRLYVTETEFDVIQDEVESRFSTDDIYDAPEEYQAFISMLEARRLAVIQQGFMQTTKPPTKDGGLTKRKKKSDGSLWWFDANNKVVKKAD